MSFNSRPSNPRNMQSNQQQQPQPFRMKATAAGTKPVTLGAQPKPAQQYHQYGHQPASHPQGGFPIAAGPPVCPYFASGHCWVVGPLCQHGVHAYSCETNEQHYQQQPNNQFPPHHHNAKCFSNNALVSPAESEESRSTSSSDTHSIDLNDTYTRDPWELAQQRSSGRSTPAFPKSGRSTPAVIPKPPTPVQEKSTLVLNTTASLEKKSPSPAADEFPTSSLSAHLGSSVGISWAPPSGSASKSGLSSSESKRKIHAPVRTMDSFAHEMHHLFRDHLDRGACSFVPQLPDVQHFAIRLAPSQGLASRCVIATVGSQQVLRIRPERGHLLVTQAAYPKTVGQWVRPWGDQIPLEQAGVVEEVVGPLCDCGLVVLPFMPKVLRVATNTDRHLWAASATRAAEISERLLRASPKLGLHAVEVPLGMKEAWIHVVSTTSPELLKISHGHHTKTVAQGPYAKEVYDKTRWETICTVELEIDVKGIEADLKNAFDVKARLCVLPCLDARLYCEMVPDLGAWFSLLPKIPKPPTPVQEKSTLVPNTTASLEKKSPPPDADPWATWSVEASTPANTTKQTSPVDNNSFGSAAPPAVQSLWTYDASAAPSALNSHLVTPNVSVKNSPIMPVTMPVAYVPGRNPSAANGMPALQLPPPAVVPSVTLHHQQVEQQLPCNPLLPMKDVAYPAVTHASRTCEIFDELASELDGEVIVLKLHPMSGREAAAVQAPLRPGEPFHPEELVVVPAFTDVSPGTWLRLPAPTPGAEPWLQVRTVSEFKRVKRSPAIGLLPHLCRRATMDDVGRRERVAAFEIEVLQWWEHHLIAEAGARDLVPVFGVEISLDRKQCSIFYEELSGTEVKYAPKKNRQWKELEEWKRTKADSSLYKDTEEERKVKMHGVDLSELRFKAHCNFEFKRLELCVRRHPWPPAPVWQQPQAASHHPRQPQGSLVDRAVMVNPKRPTAGTTDDKPVNRAVQPPIRRPSHDADDEEGEEVVFMPF